MAASITKAGGDGKFFQTTKKGEIMELKTDLNSLNKDKVKDAVKKVIASMTIGKDVSSLFTDVIKSMQTDNIELKKLVYLYLINYARSQPDKAILIVNTFQKDAMSSSPLIRALAIRTMGCIRVDRITEYLAEPLAKAAKDRDAYVRKTAALAIAKMYDLNKELVEEQGFLNILRDMLGDANHMVVANAVAALQEIQEQSEDNTIFEIDSTMLSKLLAALNECTEWGQVFILDALSRFEASSSEAEEIIERVTPRLKHANSAVSMSAVKVIMKYLDVIQNDKLTQVLLQEKLPPPLITLLSEHKPEIQYVALRNINIIVQKQPNILQNAVKHFFCKYNDPIYVKMEKLEIMIRLTNVKNIDKVLMEFKEYATEVDVDFVRKSVLAIGRCAIKISQAAEKCISVLLELIQTKVNYVVQEAIIVIKDIFRKYPNKYESIIATLCENLDTLDEPEAKAAMIWIIGEYSDRIDNAPELLESFVEHFEDEQAQVQLQLLTAIVKLFLKRPEDAKELVGNVLNLATSHADNPDLRDRGYVYWRLLSTDPEAAQSVVLAQKPTITDDTYQMDPKLLNVLVANISTLSSIYHKPPEAFVKEHRTGALRRKEDDEDDDSDDGGDSEAMDDDDEDDDDDEEDSDEDESPRKSAPSKPAASSSGGALDLLNLGGLSLEPSKPSNSGSADFDIFGTSAPAPAPAPVSIPSEEPLVPTLPASAGKSLAITSRVTRRGGQIFLDLQLENRTQQTLSKFAVKFNDNFLGLAPTGPFAPGAIAVGGSTKFALPLGVSKPPVSNNHGLIQIAIKTETDIVYLNQPVHAGVLFTEDGRLGDQEFLRYWKEIPDSNETIQPINMSSAPTPDQLKTRLGPFNVFYVASRVVNKATGGQASYFSLFFNNTKCLLEVKVDSGKVQACVKSGNKEYSQEVLRAITTILSR